MNQEEFRTTTAPWRAPWPQASTPQVGQRKEWGFPDPVRPEGAGWEMCGSTATADRLFWFWKRESPAGELASIRVTDLPLSTRIQSGLEYHRVTFVSDLVSYTEKEARAFKNIGRKSFDELTEVMKSMGLSFRQPFGAK